MHVQITTSGPWGYVQLAESFRDDQGRIRKRTVATLGRLDQVSGSLDAVINGLLKTTGHAPVLGAEAQPEVEFEPARALGAVWALDELWRTLGFGELRRGFRGARHQIDGKALIRVMVFNRLCDPESKLGVLRWLETVALRDVAETRTLLPTLATVLKRFPSVRRLVLVADRGLLSPDKLEALRKIRLANGRALEFIRAVPGRRYNEFLKALRAFHKNQCQDAQAEVITEHSWHDLRLIVAHDPVAAAEQTDRRNERIAALIDQANAWAEKLLISMIGPGWMQSKKNREHHFVCSLCGGAH